MVKRIKRVEKGIESLKGEIEEHFNLWHNYITQLVTKIVNSYAE